jgi:hypothetical protein
MVRAPHLGVAIAVTLALVNIASAAVAPGDHYLCHSSRLFRGEVPPALGSTHLKDQFEDRTYLVGAPNAICNPATKNFTSGDEPPAFPAVHQEAYGIHLPPGQGIAPRTHFIKDQFGVLYFSAIRADSLLVRSGKLDLGTNFGDDRCRSDVGCSASQRCLGGVCVDPSFPTAPADTVGVDNFKCYRVAQVGSPRFHPILGGRVEVTDQFDGPRKYSVLRPTKLCNPVNVDGRNPGADQHVGHLVCYEVRQSRVVRRPRFLPHKVSVSNGFFPDARLDTRPVRELCVPSLEDTLTTTTTTTTTTIITIPPPFSSLDFTTGIGTGSCGDTKDKHGNPIRSLDCGRLYLGGSGTTAPVPPGATPDGSTNRFGFTGCAAVGDLCLLGPTTTPGADFDCTDTGCNFGAPLPIPNGGTSTCVVNTLGAPASGTIDMGTGESNISLTLRSHIFLVGDVNNASGQPQPCPICESGSCTAGPNHDMPCTTTNSTGLSRDCPPGTLGMCAGGVNGAHVCTNDTQCPDSTCSLALVFDPPLTVDLTPLVTATASASDPEGSFCPQQAAIGHPGHPGCFTAATCALIEEHGVPAGSLLPAGTPKATTLSSVFCVPRTGNYLVDELAAGFPGPGAITLPGTMTVNP